MTPSTPLTRFTLFATLLVCPLLNAFAVPVKFNIPAQSAPDALKLFIKQSGTQVMFVADEVKAIQANEVVGDFEPGAALLRLLHGTGYTATERKTGWFAVVREKTAADSGSVRGNLVGPGGAGLADVLVTIRETTQSAETDRNGQYGFPKVAAGTYVFVATAPGYQPMHITEVVVRAGRDLTLGKEEMRPATGDVLALKPFVVHAEAVTELEKLEVTTSRQKPFTGANIDIPRTIDDVQPYYIFDAKNIEQSGAINVGEFLKQRLPMNTTALMPGQNAASQLGNASSVNLRGLGTDKTLVLINGRRNVGVSTPLVTGNSNSFASQTDLNGIPLNAIDRIEVLPSSASGIYGGGAIGGVVNVILKRQYQGGELRLTYDNTIDTDTARRTLAFNYGLGLEGGKTQVMLSASVTDANSLLTQDRADIFNRNTATILRNNPATLYSPTNAFLGATPNIRTTAASLILDDGTSLNSQLSYVPAGISGTTPAATLASGLLANAGVYNLRLPNTPQSPTGLKRPLGTTPDDRQFMATLRRQMSPNIEVFADYSQSRTKTASALGLDQLGFTATVAASSPTNPFQNTVVVRFPDPLVTPFTTLTRFNSASAGAIIKLPADWTAELDYTWSYTFHESTQLGLDSTALAADAASGALNVFVDTQLFPLNTQRYVSPFIQNGSTTLHDFTLRANGDLPALPWGTPSLTVGLEHRHQTTPENYFNQFFVFTTANNSSTTYFNRKQDIDSAYGELSLPLVKKNRWPLLYSLELQLAGRADHYKVSSGTQGISSFSGFTFFNGPTLNGARLDTEAKYKANNSTAGFKYQPWPDVTIRVSRASAFIPPTAEQLAINPLPDTAHPTVIDPKQGNTSVVVQTRSGGNDTLKPQSSKSFNAGIIWQPHWASVKGLRFNVEYYRTEQFNAIAALTAQQMVNVEDSYPGRVVRDASGTITFVDRSNVNLLHNDTSGFDSSVDYTLQAGSWGVFNLLAAATYIQHLKTQYSILQPEYDAAGFHPTEDSANSSSGSTKYKGNVTLSWDWHRWSAGWNAQYFGTYKMVGAAGGPNSLRTNNGAAITTFILPQGGDTVPSQTYHDLYMGYSFGKRAAKDAGFSPRSLLSDLTVQFGLRNVFNTVPPFDAAYSLYGYTSAYGNLRLRSYWLSVRKSF